MERTSNRPLSKGIKLFEKNGGLLRTSKALKEGLHPRTLYEMEREGLIVKLSRGLYRLSDRTEASRPDLLIAGSKIPQGVICLISALSFHNLSTQIPREVWIALRQGMTRPRIDYPPIHLSWFSEESYAAGVDSHEIDGVEIKIFSPEKTITDCFKFRNTIGLDVALEALKNWRKKAKAKNIEQLMKYAKICRIEKIMKPYLEAIL